MVEVKSASGKSMMVPKATFEQIMASKASKKASKNPSVDRQELIIENENLEADKVKNNYSSSASFLVSPMKMERRRSQGV